MKCFIFAWDIATFWICWCQQTNGVIRQYTVSLAIYGQRHSITVKLSVWEFLWMDPKHTPAKSWPYMVNTKYSKVRLTFWGHVGRAVTEDFPWVFGTSTWWVHKDHIWSTIIIAMFTVSGFWDHKWPGFTENICPYMVYTTLYLSTWLFWDFK